MDSLLVFLIITIVKRRVKTLKGDVMLKGLGILIGGVFVGAVSVEVVRRKCPDTLEKLYSKTHEVVSEVKMAFKNGYEKASQPRPAIA